MATGKVSISSGIRISMNGGTVFVNPTVGAVLVEQVLGAVNVMANETRISDL